MMLDDTRPAVWRLFCVALACTALAATAAGVEWSPTDVPGLDLWVHAGAGVTLDAKGGVERWADQSGSGNDFVQEEAELRPRFVDGAANGHGAVLTDGIDDALVLTSPVNPSGKSVFVVVKWNELRAYSFAVGLDAGTDGYLRLHRANELLTGGFYPVIYQNGIPSPKDGPPGYDRKIFHFLPDLLTEWNVFAVTDNPERPEAIKYLGRNEHNNEPGNRFSGQVAVLLIYGRSLGKEEREQVEDYLSRTYRGIPRRSGPPFTAQSRGAAAAAVAARAKLSPYIQNETNSTLVLTEVRPARLFNWSGDDVAGYVELRNDGMESETVAVTVHLASDLGDVTGTQKKTVTVPASETVRLEFAWPSAEVGLYGHAMAVRVESGGEHVARGEEFFGVAAHLWDICIPGTHPVGYTADHAKDLPDIERRLEGYRDKHLNVFEKFFWAQDDFGHMTPTAETWFSGQARYHEHMGRFRHLCEYGLEIGVMPTTYGKSIGSGSGARDLIRRRPELVYGFGGVLDFHPDTEELAKWDIVAEDPRKEWQSIGWAHYNMNDPAVVQHGIDQIIASTRQFGWSAVRFDGHFRARQGKQRVGDSDADFTADAADRQTAVNQRALKDQALAEFPRYAFGYNFAECGFDKRLETQPREAIELCAGTGLVMDEYARSNNDGAHPYRNWAAFASMLVRETEQTRRLGGVLLPLVQGGLLGRYQTLLIYAAGAHPGMAATHTIDHPYNAFATRYSSVLWHKDIRNVWNPNGMVIVPGSVWWEEYVRVHDLDDGRRRLIVHLINPPPHETAVETVAKIDEVRKRDARRRQIASEAGAHKVEPDFSEVDDLAPIALTPPAQTDIPVRVVPQAFDRPWRAARALLLDPEAVTQSELEIDQSDPYFWEVRVPKLEFWAVVVVEMEVKQ